MGRTEEVCLEIDVGLVHIAEVGGDAVAQAADVVERVVAEAVAARLHHFKFGGMLADVVADHEEGGLDAVVVEHV